MKNKLLRFEIWKAKSKALKVGRWYWHIRAANGEVICQSEGYSRRAGCIKIYKLLFGVGASAILVDLEAKIPDRIVRLNASKSKYLGTLVTAKKD